MMLEFSKTSLIYCSVIFFFLTVPYMLEKSDYSLDFVQCSKQLYKFKLFNCVVQIFILTDFTFHMLDI